MLFFTKTEETIIVRSSYGDEWPTLAISSCNEEILNCCKWWMWKKTVSGILWQMKMERQIWLFNYGILKFSIIRTFVVDGSQAVGEDISKTRKRKLAFREVWNGDRDVPSGSRFCPGKVCSRCWNLTLNPQRPWNNAWSLGLGTMAVGMTVALRIVPLGTQGSAPGAEISAAIRTHGTE